MQKGQFNDVLYMRLSTEQLQRVRCAANDSGISVSELIREAVSTFLDQRDYPNMIRNQTAKSAGNGAAT